MAWASKNCLFYVRRVNTTKWSTGHQSFETHILGLPHLEKEPPPNTFTPPPHTHTLYNEAFPCPDNQRLVFVLPIRSTQNHTRNTLTRMLGRAASALTDGGEPCTSRSTGRGGPCKAADCCLPLVCGGVEPVARAPVLPALVLVLVLTLLLLPLMPLLLLVPAMALLLLLPLPVRALPLKALDVSLALVW